MTERVVVVVAGGESPRPSAARAVPSGATVIAADAGLEHAAALGLDVSVAVGDFDSASPAAVAAAEARGVRVVRHPAAKDATDLELALDEASALHPSRILVLAGIGDRLDHLLSLLLLLAAPRLEDVAAVDAIVGDARIHVVRSERALAGEPGELVSLLALHGRAEGVRTTGPRLPARRRDARAWLEPRRLQRPDRGRGAGLRRARRPRRDLPRPWRRGSDVTRCHHGARSRGRARRRPRRGRVRRGWRGADRGRPRHARLVRGLRRREAGFRDRKRAPAPDTGLRRRERDAHDGAPHGGQPAGGRALRRGRQPPVPSARGRSLRAVRVTRARGRGRAVRPRPGASGRRRSTTARSA